MLNFSPIKEPLLHQLSRGANTPCTRGRGTDTSLLASSSVPTEQRKHSHRYLVKLFQKKTRLRFNVLTPKKTTNPFSHVFFVPAGQSDGGVVDAIMKMWPPPAGPKDRGPEREDMLREGGHVLPQSASSEGHQPLRSSTRAPDQPALQRVLSQPGQPNPAAGTTNISTAPRPPGYTFN